jgi:N utilization substance protein B
LISNDVTEDSAVKRDQADMSLNQVNKHASIRGRVRARRCAVQALYQWQLAGQDPKDILIEFVADRELIKVDLDYFKQLSTEIPANIDDLRNHIGSVIDRNMDDLDPVEFAVLMIGAYELSSCLEVPWRVVVNEAVELSKMFGATDGHKFINGALDKLAKKLRSTEIKAT